VGLSAAQLVSPLQVHGLRVVGTSEYADETAERLREGQEPLGCDGLTLHAGLDVGIAPLLLFADCVPVVLAGEMDVAVLHGGWRGVLDGIVAQGAAAMVGPPGMAFIGPSIGPCCFAVTAELAEDFADRYGDRVVAGTKDDPHVDLWAAVEVALAEVGVPAPPMWSTRACAPAATTTCSSPTGPTTRSRAVKAAWPGPRPQRGEGMLEVRAETLRRNLEQVRTQIGQAAEKAGRKELPRLLAASKYLDAGQMEMLAEAGICLVGENRAEGLDDKWQRWHERMEFHFIGHLQSRKARQVLPYVTLIHSVESMGLVKELDKKAEKAVDVLLEVNVSREESKYGVLPEQAEGFLEQATAYGQVRFTGLMTMAPYVGRAEEARPYFRGLRELRDKLAPAFRPRYQLTELSMGMSNDYVIAVEEGATMLRIGSALFSEG